MIFCIVGLEKPHIYIIKFKVIMDILSELCYYIFYKKTLERVIFMALAEANKTTEPTYTINDAMDVLLGK